MIGTLRDDVTGVLLVGGKSRRMGRDKAFLEIAGRPMVERVLDAFRACFAQTILVGDRQERFSGYGLPVYPDIYRGNALGGLHSGLFHAATEQVFVAPCDIPFPNAGVIRYLCSLAQGHDAVVPNLAQGYEPLFAIYSKSCLKAIEDQLGRSNFCVFDFYPQVNVRFVQPEELAEIGATGTSFVNLNTPEQYQEFQSLPDNVILKEIGSCR